jgi:4-hydroxybenzoate polyprenyltransferase
MKAFLNLVRWQNLLMVIVTMILMRYAVIEPVISKINVVLIEGNGAFVPLTLQFPWYDFLVLVAATVFITAGGYVINDYFDIKTDLINRGEVIVGTRVPRRIAMMWHSILNIIGVALGFYISWKAGYVWAGMLFLVVSGLLYFYSASYKSQFLLGNIIVAILVAMVPLIVALYEWPALYRYYEVKAMSLPNLNLIFYWTGGFSIFAFLTTLTREIIKDIEDFEGDLTYGRNTVPVVIGTLSAKIVSVCLVILTVVLLYLAWGFFLSDKITLVYISLAVVVPLLFVVYYLVTGREKKQLHQASSLMKIVMVTGLLYAVLVKIILTWNLI